MLQMSLLGSISILWDQRPLSKLTSQKAQALLIYLAMESPKVHQRDGLMSLFWPDYTQKSAQQNLRQALYLIKQALPSLESNEQFFHSERVTVVWNDSAPSTLDVLRFEQLSESDRSPEEWQQAVDLYSGEFLENFYLPDSEPFEEWVGNKRAFYQRRMQEALDRLTPHYLANNQLDSAETAVRRRLELDNLQETAHRQLINILAKNGRRQEALTHFQTVEQLLEDELGIEPEPETVALMEAIREGKIISDSLQSPAIDHFKTQSKPSIIRKHNLPHRLSSFIGRQNELLEVTELINAHRLVTLVGVGGLGKTTLSIQVGHPLVDEFIDGVWLVEFAPVTDKRFLGSAILRALAVKESPHQTPIEQLKTFLSTRELLIIFDNCEHLIQPVAELAQHLLHASPKLKILATTRELLDIPGERPFYVPPLSMPQNNVQINPDQWESYEAIQLFVKRAQAIKPDFQIKSDNVGTINQICQRLDGIPLALELAAARMKTLSISQIAKHLDQRFRLLTSGNRAALPRHQTLKAMVDWSWELLSEDEQKLLRRLTVFSGGMGLATTTAVCSQNDLDEFEILDLLSQLVNKSLLNVTQHNGEPRYHLLETIQQYGLEKLQQAKEKEQFTKCHFEQFLELSKQAEKELVGSNQVKWLNQLHIELDNVRTALSYAKEHSPEEGLRFASNLWKFWEARGFIREGAGWISLLLEQSPNIAPAIKAKALGILSHLNYIHVNNDLARQQAEACMAIYQKLNDKEGIAFANHRLSSGYQRKLNLDTAIDQINESLAIYTELDKPIGIAESYQLLGELTPDSNQAKGYLQKALELFEKLEHLAGMSGVYYAFSWMAYRAEDFEAARYWLEKEFIIKDKIDNRGNVWTLLGLGNLNYRIQEYDTAISQIEKAINLGHEQGSGRAVFWGMLQLGHVYLKKGNLGRSWTYLKESIDNFEPINEAIGTIFTLEGIAMLATEREQPEQALQLISWADNQRQDIGDPRPPVEQADIDHAISIIQEMVDPNEYQSAYESGQHLSWEEGIALALTIGPK